MAQMPLTQGTVTTQETKRKTPPGPRGHFLLGLLPEFQRDPLAMYYKLAREYGDLVATRFGPRVGYFMNHPDYIKHVLQDNHRNYIRNVFVNDLIKLSSGLNLFTSEGEYWLHQRRLMQPAFHRQRIAGFGTIMTQAALAMLDRWAASPVGQPLAIEKEMMQVTLSIVSQALFSMDLSGDVNVYGHAFDVSTTYITDRMSKLFSPPLWVPIRRNREFVQSRELVNGMIQGIIDRRRQSGEDPGDLLSMLMTARDADTGEGMNDQQLRNEVATMVFAGHETTANTLTWTFYLLSEHPEVERKLHAELAEVLGGRPATIEDLPKLPYNRMVIEETMRLYPPAWAIGRQAIKEDEIGGYTIPANAPVTLVPYVLHRDPRFWENPETFEPEHFAPEQVANRPHFAYVPFGGGPRQCIGNNFAMTEAQIILATVAQRYALRLAPGHPVTPAPVFVLRTSHGLPMTLVAR